MPKVHGYIESDDLIVTVWHGVVTWEESEAVARRQFVDPTLIPTGAVA
jgi:hypothetical protein